MSLPRIWDAASFEEEMKLSLFCQEYAKTLDYEASAAKVGLKLSRKQVLERESVKDALMEIMLRRQKRLEIDTDRIVMELMTNAEHARAKGDIEGSNNSLKIIAEYLGMVNQSNKALPAGAQTAIVFGTNFTPAVPEVKHDALPATHMAADTDPD